MYNNKHKAVSLILPYNQKEENVTKPIAIFRHSPTEDPGYFEVLIKEKNLPYVIISVDQGMPVPQDVTLFAGLVLMGGVMSVNDPLPWITDELVLINQAIHHQIPVIGHCLGGQLLAKALGAEVIANPAKEYGWGTVRVETPHLAHHWFEHTVFDAFHWHGETFTLPEGAHRILTGAYCENQAFIYQDRYLGMQCHIEMTKEMIQTWCENYREELRLLHPEFQSIQSEVEILDNLDQRVKTLQNIAKTTYEKWLSYCQFD